MRIIYLLLRLYPYWALPSALLLGELAWHFRRKSRKKGMWICIVAAVIFLVTAVLWVVFRGDLYSDVWVRSLDPLQY